MGLDEHPSNWDWNQTRFELVCEMAGRLDLRDGASLYTYAAQRVIFGDARAIARDALALRELITKLARPE